MQLDPDQIFLLVMASLLGALVFAGVRLDTKTARLGSLTISGILRPASRIVIAKRWVNGRAGLLNHAALGAEEGLLLLGTRTVHTRGMLFPIDIVFLDRHGRVLAVSVAVSPGRGSIRGPRGSTAALELAAGAAIELGVFCGAQVCVTNSSQNRAGWGR